MVKSNKPGELPPQSYRLAAFDDGDVLSGSTRSSISQEMRSRRWSFYHFSLVNPSGLAIPPTSSWRQVQRRLNWFKKNFFLKSLNSLPNKFKPNLIVTYHLKINTIGHDPRHTAHTYINK